MRAYTTYTHETNKIKVAVYPIFLEQQSNPDNYHFLWAYHIKIDNQGDKIVQLKSRYWRIVDELGRLQEVKGLGVVGEQPILNPGDSFEYTSGTPLSTPSGMMEGHYLMVDPDGEEFKVTIPSFSLDSPFERVVIH